MTTLCFIRHGETNHNATGMIQGQYDAKLSQRGREQAVLLAKRLAKNPPDVLYSSDSSRAHDTARAVAESCGLSIHLDQRLREVDMGVWSNQPWREIQTRYPEEWKRVQNGDPTFKHGGGESTIETQNRMVEAVKEIVAAHAGKQIVIVSHGYAIRTYFAYLLDLSLVHMVRRFQLKNTSISYVQPPRKGKPGRLLTLNDTCHLGMGMK